MPDPIEFPDVSFYQGPINWNLMSSHTPNITIRSSQGNWPDDKFSVNYPAAKVYKMRRGIYHFFDDRYSPSEQSNLIIRLIENDLPETRVWIDWEELSYHTHGSYKGLHNVVTVMWNVEQHFSSRVTVGFYTGYYWFKANTNPSIDADDYAYLKRHPLWLAAYTADGSSGNLLVPGPWVYPPELHQFTSSGYGPGYGVSSEEIDLNRVLSNSSIYGMEAPPMYQYEATANGDGTRIRTDHSTASSYLNTYPKGTLFEGNEIFVAPSNLSNSSGTYQLAGDKWLKIIQINGKPPSNSAGPITQAVWVALIHMGSSICKLVDNGPVTPPPDTPTPPQEVRIRDKDGIWWSSTTFTQEG
jgi:GH25 family lysozyme M1 (1,4-beta-N-acetylmuramidase)